MNIDCELRKLNDTIERLLKARTFFEEHRAFLESLGDVNGFWSGSEYNFPSLNREKTLAVIRYFGGTWDKYYREDKTDYNRRPQENDTLPSMCIFGGTPPETCRIVEEEIELPAQPARKEMRRRLVCSQEAA